MALRLTQALNLLNKIVTLGGLLSNNGLLLEDNSSFILLEDNSSVLELE